MYTNKSKNLKKYKLAEESSYAVKDKSEVISAILMELERSMNIVAETIEKTKKWKPEEADIKLKNRHFSKALTAIYSLQISLNFDEGGSIAIKLFQLYEFCRLQIIEAFRHNKSDGLKKSYDALSQIVLAWDTMEK